MEEAETSMLNHDLKESTAECQKLALNGRQLEKKLEDSTNSHQRSTKAVEIGHKL